MINLLVISRFAPYDTIGHAGGKTHNYYLKALSNDPHIQTRLVSFCDNKVKDKLDLEKYGIINSVIYINDDIKHKILRRIPDIAPLIFEPHEGYELFGSMMRKMILSRLSKLKQSGYQPNIIILEWTQIVMIADEIHNIFPNSKICASEHDVTFLSYERKVNFAKNIVNKLIRRRQFLGMRKKELYELNFCDLIYTQSKKDSVLLCNNGISSTKVFEISPYYEDYSSIGLNRNTDDIIFYGAMDRAENYLSAIWFIENVFNKLTNNNIKFIVIGNRPHEALKKYESDRIIITGFVSNEELEKYFSTCLCLVAPLVIGGGIKVKILEAMSAAIPVITNKIGIEGIPAVDRESFYHCEDSNEYVEVLNNWDKRSSLDVGLAGRKVVLNNFSLLKSSELLKTKIRELTK